MKVDKLIKIVPKIVKFLKMPEKRTPPNLHKNLSDIKSILKSIHWFVRYRILAFISIGRLCTL